jgi:hypothetical protein
MRATSRPQAADTCRSPCSSSLLGLQLSKIRMEPWGDFYLMPDGEGPGDGLLVVVVSES